MVIHTRGRQDREGECPPLDTLIDEVLEALTEGFTLQDKQLARKHIMGLLENRRNPEDAAHQTHTIEGR
jgi:hypothetical protein